MVLREAEIQIGIGIGYGQQHDRPPHPRLDERKGPLCAGTVRAHAAPIKRNPQQNPYSRLTRGIGTGARASYLRGCAV